MTSILNIDAIRSQFPGLSQSVDGQPIVFLDNPGGTQVPQSVIDAVSGYLMRDNSNHGGAFATSERSDLMLHHARQALADFLNARSPAEIVFGPNMTSHAFNVSRALGREIAPGDEVVVTRMDHDANISPWLLMAEDRGAIVRWADFDVEDYTLDMEHLHGLIGERTKVVAVGYASNALGTVNDVATIVRWARDAGALTFVDAVQYAPHGRIDVQELDCDFLVCSAYKFFGPHIGVLYGRREVLDWLDAYKVRPALNGPPDKFETGTQNHEGIAGTLAAIQYLTRLGERYGGPFSETAHGLSPRRCLLAAGMAAIRAYDSTLGAALISELESVPEICIHGITDRARLSERVPTVSFTWPGHHPREISAALGKLGINVWDGNYYALAVTQRLGVEHTGGMVRVGAVHYNTLEEIRRFGQALQSLT